jgi:hypothetical protein
LEKLEDTGEPWFWQVRGKRFLVTITCSPEVHAEGIFMDYAIVTGVSGLLGAAVVRQLVDESRCRTWW